MTDFDFESRRATPQWLTAILRKNNFLSQGEVLSVDHEKPKLSLLPFVSDLVLLKVAYTENSRGRKPERIILKAIKPRFVVSEEHRELNFYNAVLDIQDELPLVTCYGTAVCPETKQYCLLLEDLTATHHQPPAPLPPLQRESEAAVSVLAAVHAYFWHHPDMGNGVFIRPSKDGVADYFQYTAGLYPKFADFLEDRIPERRKKIYQMVFDKAPGLIWPLLSDHKKLTVTHGDAHFRNFLYPNNRENSRCAIFDWQSWGVGTVTRDLSYMIAFQWFPERRQRLELPLLKFYLEVLSTHGIHYDWEDIMTEYRISVIMNLLLPVQWQYHGYAPGIWWNYLERAFAAFEDLDCRALL